MKEYAGGILIVTNFSQFSYFIFNRTACSGITLILTNTPLQPDDSSPTVTKQHVNRLALMYVYTPSLPPLLPTSHSPSTSYFLLPHSLLSPYSLLPTLHSPHH